MKKGFQRLAKRGERPNDPDLPVRRLCQDPPRMLVGGAASEGKKERPRLPVRHPSDDPARRAAAILAYRIETKFTFTLDLSRWCRSLGELLVFAFVCRIGNQISGVRLVGLHFHWISLDVLSSFVGFAGLGICRSTPPCTASVP